MRLKTTARILSDFLCRRSLRETYWEAAKTGGYLVRLLDPSNTPFAKVVAHDLRRFLCGGEQPALDDRRRELAAVEWILSAQSAAGRGVSLGYFPCGKPEWQPPYPETTGYIISSLLRYAERRNLEVVRKRALDMAAWEVEIQMPCGAVQGGPFIPSIEQAPCAFNTGMVLDGWCSAYAITKNPQVLHASYRAAEYLAGDLTDGGYFRTNGNFVSPGKIKTYACLCAWSMYRFGELAGEPRYKCDAVRSVEAAIRQQQSNGWFANNCLTRPEAPLLHTIGYTLQSILEVGVLAGRNDFIDAVRLGVDPLLSRISTDGFVNGRFYSDWIPASFSCCLTGSAQLAVVCYRLHQHTGEPAYRRSGDLLLNFLKPLQRLDSECTPVNGALAGSFPIFGEYMTAGYPNWATKYFLDALMLQNEVDSPFELERYAVDSVC
jgi:hypothetical protein